jgi:hypothetical protein
MSTLTPARTYNQSHVPRNHNGHRRISIYWSWSYPWESQRDPAALYNRFSTMTEVRNAAWPSYETPAYDDAHFLQGIAGTLELFHRSTLAFQELVGEITGHPVAVFQRIDQAGYRLPIDERVLVDTDDFAQRQVEYRHHGDPLVPRQQRFSQYTRSLMKAMDVPVHNTWGLRPAVVEGSNDIEPLAAFRDLDAHRLLDNVSTFNFHPHLPHYELTAPESDSLRVLGRQRIDPSRPHPFTAAGNTESTNFTTLFGGTDSLKNFWRNLATMK